jgi:beta-lactam-binding protein with PASTA domain
VYDEEPYQYQAPPRSPIPAAILTSVVTTLVLFFGLRLLDERGVLGRGHAGEGVEVPSLLGMRPEQARELLKGRDLLLLLSGEKEDAAYATGTIASQTPMPGSQAARGGSVQAVVSRGSSLVQVPNLVGLRPEEALRQLAAIGLHAAPQKTAPTASPPGMVGATEPIAGAPVAPGSAVTLVVSAGAAIKVPKITGMRLPRARKALEDAGFETGKIRYGSDDDRMGGVVLKQDPAEGTDAPRGSAVDLVVNED